MKVNVGLIVLGAILLLAAFVCYGIVIPWLSFTPLLTLVTVRPFEQVALLIGCVGFIAIIFGLTENAIIRSTFSIFVLMLAAGLLLGWISLNSILDFLRSLGLF